MHAAIHTHSSAFLSTKRTHTHTPTLSHTHPTKAHHKVFLIVGSALNCKALYECTPSRASAATTVRMAAAYSACSAVLRVILEWLRQHKVTRCNGCTYAAGKHPNLHTVCCSFAVSFHRLLYCVGTFHSRNTLLLTRWSLYQAALKDNIE